MPFECGTCRQAICEYEMCDFCSKVLCDQCSLEWDDPEIDDCGVTCDQCCKKHEVSDAK